MSTAEHSSPEWTGNKWFPSEIKWMRPDTMARKMGVTVRTIRNMVQRGQLEKRRENGKVWVRICTYDDEPQTQPTAPSAQAVPAPPTLHGVQMIRKDLLSQNDAEPAAAEENPENMSGVMTEMQKELASLRKQTQELNEKVLQISLAKERTELVAGTLRRTVEEQERKIYVQSEKAKNLDARLRAEREAAECLEAAAQLGFFQRKLKQDFLNRAKSLRKALPSS